MNTAVFRKLEFDKVKEQLASYTMSYLGRDLVTNLTPETELTTIQSRLDEVEEALAIVNTQSSVPIPSLDGIDRIANMLGKGYIFTEPDFGAILRFLESVTQLKRFMARKSDVAPRVTGYALALYDLPSLQEEIIRCIRNGTVVDDASPQLLKVRKKLGVVRDRIKKKLDVVMNKYRTCLQENMVSIRNERYVIPVKREYKKNVPGSVLDESASGQTVFIEPQDIQDLQFELAGLVWEEEREVSKVLSLLSGMVESHQLEIQRNLELVGHYDFLFAKAKYARAIGGKKPRLNKSGVIRLRGAKHPLLGKNASQLDFAIGQTYRGLIITGPNTGGKTVTLKTIGLFTLMMQSGLLVPVAEDSELSVFQSVLADIGDGQSIEQSLSTFSSHIKNVIEILEVAGKSSLVLLDELATGTDPGEGIGLSIAVLEELYRRTATVVATTHYNEIKRFAERDPGFENARMEFNVETLEPLYKLKIGEAGHSYAFLIAEKLGIHPEIVARSRQITYGEQLQNPTSTDQKSTLSEATVPEPATAQPVQAECTTEPSKVSPESSVRKVDHSVSEERARPLQVGDRVWIQSLKKSGVLYSTADSRGNVVVLVQKQKVTLNHKRISLYLTKEELYPDSDNYDLDIVLESKDTRRKRKVMNRKHVEGMSIEHPID